jgi:hypothetical protein
MKGCRSSALWGVLALGGLLGTAVPGVADEHEPCRHRLVSVGRPGEGG